MNAQQRKYLLGRVSAFEAARRKLYYNLDSDVKEPPDIKEMRRIVTVFDARQNKTLMAKKHKFDAATNKFTTLAKDACFSDDYAYALKIVKELDGLL